MMLVVEHDVEEGTVHTQYPIIVHEAQLSELVHKEIDAGTGRADHVREHVLIHVGEGELRFPFLAKIR